jgi:hypothetical protein
MEPPSDGGLGGMMEARMQVRRLAGVAIALLLVSCWRPTTVSHVAPVLRAPHKRLRNCPSELPQTVLVRSRTGDQRPRREGRSHPPLVQASARFGSGVPLPARATATLALWQHRPTYLQAYLVLDSSPTLAPPVA